MTLHTVTISGPDDGTTAPELTIISKEYPFVEWGILLSAKKKFRPGFPTNLWISEAGLLSQNGIRFSGHICGEWAINICKGKFPEELDRPMFKRIQLNIADFFQTHIKDVEVLAASLPGNREYIIQVGAALLDGLSLVENLQKYGLNISVLFDASGGHGITPKQWPSIVKGVNCGFAGGLGPDNLAKELSSLASKVGETQIWIDMQSKVRTENGKKLDLEKVRHCLDIANRYVN